MALTGVEGYASAHPLAPVPAKTEFPAADLPSLIKRTEGALADLRFEKAYQVTMKAVKLDIENIKVLGLPLKRERLNIPLWW